MFRHPAFVLLLVMVLVLSWLLGRQSNPPDAPDAPGNGPAVTMPVPAPPPPTSTPPPPVASAPAQPAGRLGMTWGVMTTMPMPEGTVFVSCHGEPQTASGSCDAYRGDTACATPLPLLCLNVDGSPRPPGLHAPAVAGAMPDDFYAGWAGGKVASTAPMPGAMLKSRAAADATCKAAFGEGWRLAEFHDGGRDKAPITFTVQDPGRPGTRTVTATGGWGFHAAGDVVRTSRFWVAIDDQPANCWD